MYTDEAIRQLVKESGGKMATKDSWGVPFLQIVGEPPKSYIDIIAPLLSRIANNGKSLTTTWMRTNSIIQLVQSLPPDRKGQLVCVPIILRRQYYTDTKGNTIFRSVYVLEYGDMDISFSSRDFDMLGVNNVETKGYIYAEEYNVVGCESMLYIPQKGYCYGVWGKKKEAKYGVPIFW